MYLERYKIILLKPLYRFDNNINEKKNFRWKLFLEKHIINNASSSNLRILMYKTNCP